jgi:acyl-CoA reductase-like NAD-dependent aldehyde dehydrogenase
MASATIKTISPVDGGIVVERKCHSKQEIDEILFRATNAFKAHRHTPLKHRLEIANKFLDLLLEKKDILVLMSLNRLTSGSGVDQNDGETNQVYSQGN